MEVTPSPRRRRHESRVAQVAQGLRRPTLLHRARAVRDHLLRLPDAETAARAPAPIVSSDRGRHVRAREAQALTRLQSKERRIF